MSKHRRVEKPRRVRQMGELSPRAADPREVKFRKMYDELAALEGADEFDVTITRESPNYPRES